ncbi:JAB domain-containing protein, partial [Longimonas sp.]
MGRNLQPSKADMEITKKLKGASKLMDIKVLDSIIVTEENYF